MDRGKLESFRRLLTETRDALLHEVVRTANGVVKVQESSGDLADQASVESHQGLLLRMRERDRGLLGKIHEALDRIESGTHGICQACGEAISGRRLMARPVTTLCIAC